VAKGEHLSKSQLILADAIWAAGAFKVGSFRLKLHETDPEAPFSPFYISMREKNVKEGQYPMLQKATANALYIDTLPLVAERNIDYVVGIPNAGTPLAEAYAVLSDIPQLKMTKVETSAGRFYHLL